MPEEKARIVFEVDNELKQEFLDRQKKTTREFYSYVLQKADEFEKGIGKKIYDLNIEERDELLLTKYKNKSKSVFQTNLSPLRTFVDFCISEKHIVKSNENRFASILPQDYSNYINIQAQENLYTSKSEIRELQKKLVNAQDKLILELLTWGVRGRTEAGNTHEELINLMTTDVDYKNKILTVTRNDNEVRFVEVDDYTLDLIKNTIKQETYMGNNGAGKIKDYTINSSIYVFRTPGKNRTGKVDPQLFTRRVSKMQKWLDKPYLTVSSLWFSSLIDYAKQIKADKGELTRDDYIRINEKFDYGDTKERQTLYWIKTADLIKPYL